MSKESDKPLLIYDLVSIPKSFGIDMDKVMWAYKEHQVLLWDSSRGGQEPKVINSDVTFMTIDTSDESERHNIEKYTSMDSGESEV